MKTKFLLALVAWPLLWTLLHPPLSHADEFYHSDESYFGSREQAAPGDVSEARAVWEHRLAQMTENVRRMSSQLEKARRTNEPAERQRLLAEHLQMMRENIKLVQIPLDDRKIPGNMALFLRMVNQRLDMLQMMLVQLIEHQGQVSMQTR